MPTPTPTVVTTRQTTATNATNKGAPLTNAEMDANFVALNNGKVDVANNLSDVADVPAARQNLGVYSATQTDSQAIAMAIALG